MDPPAASASASGPPRIQTIVDYRDRNEVLSGLAAFTFLPANLSGNGEPEQIAGTFASGNYFDVLGVKPALGRRLSSRRRTIPVARCR
jgi:hypothetical protein